MTDYVISCSSTVDMPREFLEERNIPFVPFHFILDEKEYEDDLGKTVPFDEFYKRIADGAMPTTSQVNVGQYTDFFKSFLEKGKDILHIELSSGLSGSYNSAVAAQELLAEEYPERTIRIVDSLAASSGYGLLMTLAADLRDNGKSLEEVADWVEANKLRIHHWFFSTDLTHFKRGGRISATSALVGGMLNIAPLMNMSNDGKLTPRKKVRGKKQVMKEMVARMEEHAENGTDYSGKCYISHSAVFEDARTVADMIEERFSNLDGSVMITDVGTTVGSHTGPGTVALFFTGSERID